MKEETKNNSKGDNKTVPDGWIYLGNKNSKLIVNRPVNEASLKTVEYTLRKGANMRVNKPQPPSYKNQKLIRVLEEGTSFIIDTFTIDKKGHVWAHIDVR